MQNREWYEKNIVRLRDAFVPNREGFLSLLNLSKMPVGVLLNAPREVSPMPQRNMVEEVRKYDISYLIS